MASISLHKQAVNKDTKERTNLSACITQATEIFLQLKGLE